MSVTRRPFTVERGGGPIPGIVWIPDDQNDPCPLILLGHGGGGSKFDFRRDRIGKLLSGRGFCVAAIDAVGHGDRGPVRDPAQPEYRALWQRGDAVEIMIADWMATLDYLVTLDEVDSMKVAYYGLSMGTMFGLPYVASDERVRAAVLGKAGMSGPSVRRSRIDKYFTKYAPKLKIPTLFTMQWDDRSFDRKGCLELFDLIGSKDKRLVAYPGDHNDEPVESEDLQAAFLERCLG